jgi:hypothetical protein
MWSICWNENWEKPRLSSILSAINPIYSDLDSNPGRSGGKPATNSRPVSPPWSDLSTNLTAGIHVVSHKTLYRIQFQSTRYATMKLPTRYCSSVNIYSALSRCGDVQLSGSQGAWTASRTMKNRLRSWLATGPENDNNGQTKGFYVGL